MVTDLVIHGNRFSLLLWVTLRDKISSMEQQIKWAETVPNKYI